MSKKLAINDIVQFRLYNTPDARFYGNTRKGRIIHIQTKENILYFPFREYVIQEEDDHIMTLDRKEILRRITE